MSDNSPSFGKIQETIRAEFKLLFDRINTLHARISALEHRWHREDGFREGSGSRSIHEEIRELRFEINAIKASIFEFQTQAKTVGAGIPWFLTVAGGVVGIATVIGTLVLYLSK